MRTLFNAHGAHPEADRVSESFVQVPQSLALPRNQTILLAEDDDDLLHLTRAFLREIGYTVLTCSDGRIAAEVFRRTPDVDLLLTDIRMPGISGMELARDLTALRPCLPVLMISGGGLTDALEDEMRTRGWQFLSKPWRFADLLAAVHSILGMPESQTQEVELGRS